MNIFHFFKDYILTCLGDLKRECKWPDDLDFNRVTIEPPKQASHGDLSTNAAMILAKPLALSPRVVADLLVQKLNNHPDISAVSVAGPGFINFSLHANIWYDRLNDILTQGLSYGGQKAGNKEVINIEFVSANPTGPLHTGHGRGAVYGDVLAALFEKIGYSVCREYYINDAGGQTDTLARSAYLRYLQALGEDVKEERFEGLYPGDYLVPIGDYLAVTHGNKWKNAAESEWIGPIRTLTIDRMMDVIKDDLRALGVKMNVFTSESKLVKQGRVEECLSILQEKGDLYKGILEKPKGHNDADWEARPQTLFKATQYGDDVDRALKKSNGEWTYFAGDIAYHLDKYKRGFAKMIDVLGADHGGYIKRIQAATRAVTHGQVNLDVKVTQLVNFMENGEPVKMSKRAGTFIKLRDVIDRVGKDVTRFMMLTRRQDVTIDFDFIKVQEQTRDNPVFYVQYAHARCCSVLRHAQAQGFRPHWQENIASLLTDDAELDMIKILANWPRQVEIAAQAYEPHRLAFYLQDVAAAFHSLWNKGKEQTHLRFIEPENKDLTQARLALVQGIAIIIASGLTLFGITPVEEMR